jgi:pyrimidine-nucleoside phosphorylase
VIVGELTERKRDGGELTAQEIREVVAGYTRAAISDAEMAALLRAIVLRGMTSRETADLTLAMVESGERLDLSRIPGSMVDKHSTGGVGDKTTLVVAPLVASLGVPVPKMSGRALGHTGGTIDKLECIPGLTTDLTPERFCDQVAEIGVAIAAQTAEMAPADRKIYALRDATGTVESIPLIASSVMSKKLAVGADGIVLDVKAGTGAFMSDVGAATRLAEAMVEIGSRAGKRVVALVTRMEEPLGRAVGDGIELAEAIDTLRGEGPPDFVQLCEIVAGHMLVLGGAAREAEEGTALARRGLSNGSGLAKLREMIERQGGDAGVVDDPGSLTGNVTRIPVMLTASGTVVAIDARRIGLAVRELKAAAGEQKTSCGVVLHKKTGDRASCGEPVATVLSPPEARGSAEEAGREVADAFRMGACAAAAPDLVAAVVEA